MQTIVSTSDMAARGQAYTDLKADLDRRGPAKLTADERAQIFDTADALLFGEDDAAAKLADTEALLDRLAQSGRWLEDGIDTVKRLLRSTGA